MGIQAAEPDEVDATAIFSGVAADGAVEQRKFSGTVDAAAIPPEFSVMVLSDNVNVPVAETPPPSSLAKLPLMAL